MNRLSELKIPTETDSLDTVQHIQSHVENSQLCLTSGIEAIGDLLASIDAGNQAVLEDGTLVNTGYLLTFLAQELTGLSEIHALAQQRIDQLV